jgi:hypothetical protein
MKMMKFKIEDMRVVSVDELKEKLCVDESDFVESGVYKIEVGSRGEIEGVSKVEVKDGVFEVKSVEEMLDSCIDEEEREEMEDWVYVEMSDGKVEVCEFEEYGYDYYMVEVLSKEERLVEMVSSVEEELSEDFMDLVESEVEENCDLYKVKEMGEYKDWYVLMCYDYGDSLCEIEVSENREDLVK